MSDGAMLSNGDVLSFADFPEILFDWWDDFPEVDVPCQECGRCCVSPGNMKIAVRLFDEDLTRMPYWVRSKYTESCIGGGLGKYSDRIMRTELRDGHMTCSAFQRDENGMCACTIYNHRPNNCRYFEAGAHCLVFLEGVARAYERQKNKPQLVKWEKRKIKEKKDE